MIIALCLGDTTLADDGHFGYRHSLPYKDARLKGGLTYSSTECKTIPRHNQDRALICKLKPFTNCGGQRDAVSLGNISKKLKRYLLVRNLFAIVIDRH